MLSRSIFCSGVMVCLCVSLSISVCFALPKFSPCLNSRTSTCCWDVLTCSSYFLHPPLESVWFCTVLYLDIICISQGGSYYRSLAAVLWAAILFSHPPTDCWQPSCTPLSRHRLQVVHSLCPGGRVLWFKIRKQKHVHLHTHPTRSAFLMATQFDGVHKKCVANREFTCGFKVLPNKHQWPLWD